MIPDDLSALILQLERRKSIYRLENYKPYPYQIKFHHVDGYKTPGKLAQQRMLCAGNQLGKTWCGAMEMAMHLTGQYPEWWEGTRYRVPIEALIGSNTNETCRDIIQKELFGEPADDTKMGTGTIPIDCIGKIVKKAGVPNSFDAVRVKHVSGGWSIVRMRAYEQGFKKFMGIRFDVGWADEEPPEEIWSQFIRGTLARPKAILYTTMTPEEGMTNVVAGFLHDLKEGQAILNATWDDAPHMTEDVKRQRLATLPPHEREMRSKGVPIVGSGLVFPVNDEILTVEQFDIPKHWPRICAIDFGWDHPFAAAWIAWDRDTDKVYVYDTYRESKATPPIHAASIRSRGDWIPVVWPHDGLNADKGSGKALAEQYRSLNVNMMAERFQNPDGGNNVEPGIMDMLTRMEQGRFKVFSNQKEWFEERRMYHRKNGKIIALQDDLMSATRYAVMSLRHAVLNRPKNDGHYRTTRGGAVYLSSLPKNR